jgi:hypothetical protein
MVSETEVSGTAFFWGDRISSWISQSCRATRRVWQHARLSGLDMYWCHSSTGHIRQVRWTCTSQNLKSLCSDPLSKMLISIPLADYYHKKVSLKETQGGHRWIGQVGHSLNRSGSHVRGTWVCATTGKKLRRPWARHIHTRMFLLQFARFSRRNLRFVSPMIVSRRDLADQVKPPSFLLSVFVCLSVFLSVSSANTISLVFFPASGTPADTTPHQ